MESRMHTRKESCPGGLSRLCDPGSSRVLRGDGAGLENVAQPRGQRCSALAQDANGDVAYCCHDFFPRREAIILFFPKKHSIKF